MPVVVGYEPLIACRWGVAHGNRWLAASRVLSNCIFHKVWCVVRLYQLDQRGKSSGLIYPHVYIRICCPASFHVLHLSSMSEAHPF